MAQIFCPGCDFPVAVEGLCECCLADEREAEAQDYGEPDCDFADAEDERDGFRDDVEADADTLASAGYGTDEDYGAYGGYEDGGDCWGDA